MQKSNSLALRLESRKSLEAFLSSLSDSSDFVFEVLTHDPITLFHFQAFARKMTRETESGNTVSSVRLAAQLGTVLDLNLIGG